MNFTFFSFLIGALGLFLYAINGLSKTFSNANEERATKLFEKVNSSLYSGIFWGLVATLMLDSSSAVIIITIILLNSGKVGLLPGIGISLGANIGTTFQSQLFAFDWMEWAFIPMVIGLLIGFFANKKASQNLGRILFFIGLLFYSIFIIEQQISTPEMQEYVRNWILEHPSKPLQSAFIGGIITVLIQSSGATVGLIITLAKQGLLTAKYGIAIMIGSELGTCSNTLIATIGGKREGLVMVLFNIVFNLLMVVLGILFFDQFMFLVEYLFEEFSEARKIANAHVLFNVMGVILILPTVNIISKTINRITPNL